MNVADEVRDAYGLDVVSAERVTHGLDPNADVWRVTTADGTTYAVKTGGGNGPRVCAHLAGIPGVPRPLPARHATGLAVLPWIAGRRAIEGGMTERHWRAFGTLLRRVHDAQPVDGLPRETHTHDRQAATLLDLDARAAGTLDVWDSGAARALVARADALRGEVTGAPYVTCHADPWVGNVIHDGDDVWLIDWDDAVLAPRERDLMLVVCGVRDWAPFDAAGEAAFREGYGTYDADATRLAYYLCVRAMEDLALAETALDGSHPDAQWARGIVRGLFAAGGAVTRALGR